MIFFVLNPDPVVTHINRFVVSILFLKSRDITETINFKVTANLKNKIFQIKVLILSWKKSYMLKGILQFGQMA